MKTFSTTAMLILSLLIHSPNSFSSTDENIQVKTSFNYSFYPMKIIEDENIKVKIVNERLNFPPQGRGPSGEIQKQKLLKAYELIELIVNSKIFKEKVLSYSGPTGKCKKPSCYSGNYLWNDASKKLSNLDIYNTIMKGDEKMRPFTENEINLNLTWDDIKGRVIGRTRPSSSEWIEVNWKRYYWRYSSSEMVSNVLHEWIHLLGFLHTGDKSMNPTYVIGDIAGKLAQAYLDGDINLLD